MPNDDRLFALKARWVFPVASPPVRNGVVWIAGDQIIEVTSESRDADGPDSSSIGVPSGTGGARFCSANLLRLRRPDRQAIRATRDLGNVAILPGLINTHTHLELSGFSSPLGQPGLPITDWIKLVVQSRNSPAHDAGAAVRQGIEESRAAGVAALGDIVQTAPDDARQAATLDTTAFLELIAPTESRVPEALAKAEAYLKQYPEQTPWRPGLSPHAPYSVYPALLEGVCRLSYAHRVPLAFHLAESPEEMQLLRDATGPFRDLLQALDAWDPEVWRPRRRPMDYLELLAKADRALVIHGNYLSAEEIAFLGRNSERMSVVYCPRTHTHFQHAPYPLEAMLAAGVHVALGIDSRASSPDLNLLGEIRATARCHPAVPRQTILELGTLGGAKALGIEARFGTLEPGKSAQVAVVDLPNRESSDPHDLLFDT